MPRFSMSRLRNNNVLDLYRQREIIDLEPPYQRLSVWDVSKQQGFIDSILNGIDIPILYFHDKSTRESVAPRHRYAVIDGKQRLLALWAFLSNRLPLASEFVYFEDPSYEAGGLTYDELLAHYPLLRARFDDFDVPVVLVEADEDDFIEQLFARLNVQVALTSPERRNAFGGPVPYIIRKIAVSPYFREAARIRNDRLQHFDLAAKFLYITYRNDFVDTKSSNLNNFVKTMKKARNEGQEIGSEQALSIVEAKTQANLESQYKMFGPRSPLLGSSGRMVLYFQLFRLFQESAIPIPFTLNMLEKFNADVTSSRRKSQRMSRGSGESFQGLDDLLVRFDQEKQSTNQGSALKRQYDHLRRYLIEEFSCGLPTLRN